MKKILKSNNTYSSFNGVNSYLQYADNDIFSFTDGVNDIPFEIEFDIISTNNSATSRYIFQKAGSASTYEWLIYINAGKVYCFLSGNATATIYFQKITSSALILNQKTRVKITYDGSALVGGINIYFDNVAQPFTSSSVGSYVKMTNYNGALNIGRGWNNTLLFNGYLRNLKITKNNQLVFWATLQDSNNIGKDIISGLSATANNVSVVDINEGGNWTYFNGVNASASIGTTSTLGWMNSGVFNMEFELRELNSSIKIPISTSTVMGGIVKGWFIYKTSVNIYLYWSDGSTYIINSIALLTSFIVGNNYKFVIKGDGAKYYYTSYNNDNSINKTNEPTGTVVSYLASTTTSLALSFSKSQPSTAYEFDNVQIRNFKIFTDTAGTIPFMSLPMQSKDDLMVDRVSGLVGTSTNVQIINNNTNLLKSQNRWMQFNKLSASYMYFGTTSTLAYIHQTGVFRIEFDYIQSAKSGYVFYTNGSSSWTFGGIAIMSNGGSLLNYCGNSTGGTLWTLASPLKLSQQSHIKIYGNGSTLFVDINNAITSYNFVGMPNSGVCYNAPVVGAGTANYITGAIKNLKFYNSTDTSSLLHYFPLQDSLNIGKDIIGGLAGTIVNNVSVVDINEGGNWAYFNGVNSTASIGTTSTLGWMNSGVFNMWVDIKPLETNSIIYTALNANHRGFTIYISVGKIYIDWSNGSGVIAVSLATAPISFDSTYTVNLRGDGSKLYYTIYDVNMGVLMTNEPTGVACTFTPFATTTSALQFCTYLFSNHQVRNFKIYSDFAGTIPFMSLPMQNSTDLMLDRVSGLQGTATNVSIINNNTNVLRNKNLWAKFDKNIGSVISIGTTSTLAWISNGIFSISFDFIYISKVANSYLYYNYGSLNQYGIACFMSASGDLVFRQECGGSYIYSITPTALVVGVCYKVTIKGNGSQIQVLVVNNGTSIVHYDSGLVSCTYSYGATTQYVLKIGDITVKPDYYLRNFKICSDFDGKVPFMNLPLTDGGNIGKDIVGGLQGTATNVTVVERQEQLWSYFNGTSSVASIGTTSTLGWMNSGVFNMEFEIKLLNTVNNRLPISNASNTNQRGFMFLTQGSYLKFYWCNGSGTYGAVISPIISGVVNLGKFYRINIKGDGVKLYYTVYNEDNTINTTNEPTGISCTYIANLTTSVSLHLSDSYIKEQLRNFKIYQDFAGTIPFMNLPLQDKDNLMLDRVNGLQGTSTDVKVITEY